MPGVDYHGGGILVTDGSYYFLQYSQIDDNRATYGGGIAILDSLDDPWLRIVGLNVHGNTAYKTGGGVYMAPGIPFVAVSTTTLSGNSASIDGGAIANHATISVVQSTLSGNTSSGATGGILNAGTLDVWSSTIADNSGHDLYNVPDVGASGVGQVPRTHITTS